MVAFTEESSSQMHGGTELTLVLLNSLYQEIEVTCWCGVLVLMAICLNLWDQFKLQEMNRHKYKCIFQSTISQQKVVEIIESFSFFSYDS